VEIKRLLIKNRSDLKLLVLIKDSINYYSYYYY
jgi:hypothetical protein